jgi:hypothetical protein
MDMTPEVTHLYTKLLECLKPLGEVVVEEKKTSIHLKSRAAFAGVHPRKEYFILTIVSDKPIQSPRVSKAEQVSKSRFHNEVRVEKEEDIDLELLEWIKEAYVLME